MSDPNRSRARNKDKEKEANRSPRRSPQNPNPNEPNYDDELGFLNDLIRNPLNTTAPNPEQFAEETLRTDPNFDFQENPANVAGSSRDFSVDNLLNEPIVDQNLENIDVAPTDINIENLLDEPMDVQDVDNLDDIFTFSQSQAQPSTSQNPSLGGTFPPQQQSSRSSPPALAPAPTSSQNASLGGTLPTPQQSSRSSAPARAPPAMSRHQRAAAMKPVKRPATDEVGFNTQGASKKTRATAVPGRRHVPPDAQAGLPSSRARTTVEQVYSPGVSRSSPASLQAPALPFLMPTRQRPSETVSRNPEATSTPPIFNPGPSSSSTPSTQASARPRKSLRAYLNEPIMPTHEIVSSDFVPSRLSPYSSPGTPTNYTPSMPLRSPFSVPGPSPLYRSPVPPLPQPPPIRFPTALASPQSPDPSPMSPGSVESLEYDAAELDAMLEGQLHSVHASASTPLQAPGSVAAPPVKKPKRQAEEVPFDVFNVNRPFYRFCLICLYKKFTLSMMFTHLNMSDINKHSARHQMPRTCHLKNDQGEVCGEPLATYQRAKDHFPRAHPGEHRVNLVEALNLRPFVTLIDDLVQEIDRKRMEALAKGVRPPELLENRNSRLLQKALNRGVQFDTEDYSPVADHLIDAYYVFMAANYDQESLEALLVQPPLQDVEIDLPDHFVLQTAIYPGSTIYSSVNSQTGEHLCLVCWFHDNVIFTANTEEELSTHFLDITHYVGVIRCEHHDKWHPGYIPRRTCDDYPIDFTTRAQWAAHEQVAEHKEHSPIPSYSELVAICMEEWKRVRRFPQETIDGRAAALGVSITQYAALVNCFLFRLAQPPEARDNRPKTDVDCPNNHVIVSTGKHNVNQQQAILDNIAAAGNVAPVVNPDLVIAGENPPQAEGGADEPNQGPVFVGPTRPDQVITSDLITTKFAAMRDKRILDSQTVDELLNKEMNKDAKLGTDEDTIRRTRFKLYLRQCKFYRSEILVHLAERYVGDSIDDYKQMLVQAHNGFVEVFAVVSMYVKTQQHYEMNPFLKQLVKLESFPNDASGVPKGQQYQFQLMRSYLDLAEAISNREINNPATKTENFNAAGNALRAVKTQMDSELLVLRENNKRTWGKNRVSTKECGAMITAVDSWLHKYATCLAKLR